MHNNIHVIPRGKNTFNFVISVILYINQGNFSVLINLVNDERLIYFSRDYDFQLLDSDSSTKAYGTW